ncbi:MFS transporter [Dactylosporangium sp. CS-047395]|uniref:MFS transporter n=1 Tax=Dactylosporangium sp. CS-047395 TaxID=3239936 RepID=UPI003D8B267F
MLWTGNFTRYFLARTVSVYGDAMLVVASALAVGHLYGATGVGLVLAAFTVPFVASVLFGGVFADRIGARPLMLGADLVRLLAQGAVAVAFFTGTPALWLLLVCSAVHGVSSAAFQPGVNGIMPLVATDLHRANATIKVAQSIAQLLGPATAGVVFGLFGAGPLYATDAATFAVSAACLATLRLGVFPRADGSTSPLRDLVGGWHEFRARTWIWSVILVWIVYGVLLFGPLIPLGSVLISGRLGAAAYGWTETGLAAGALLGGLLALRLRPARPLTAGAIAMFGYGLLPLAIALHAGLPLLLASAAVNGAAWAFWSVMWQTSVQTHIAPAMLNRITSYEIFGSDGSLPVGQALAGPVAALLTAEAVLGFSVAVSVAGCVALLLIPAVRGLRRVEPSLVEPRPDVSLARHPGGAE